MNANYSSIPTFHENTESSGTGCIKAIRIVLNYLIGMQSDWLPTVVIEVGLVEGSTNCLLTTPGYQSLEQAEVLLVWCQRAID